MRGLIAVLVLGLGGGCTAHDSAKPTEEPEQVAEPDPKPEPEPEPEPSRADAVTVAVGSVQLQQDCPRPSAKPTMKQGRTADVGRTSSKRRACQQSTLQMALTSTATEAVPFSIRAVRLKKADGGDVLQEISVREPRQWKDNEGYTAWDQSLAAEGSLKVMYALEGPDWSTVEKALGGSSWGLLYEVEVVVEIDGEEKTVKTASPRVPRDEPHNVVT